MAAASPVRRLVLLLNAWRFRRTCKIKETLTPTSHLRWSARTHSISCKSLLREKENLPSSHRLLEPSNCPLPCAMNVYIRNPHRLLEPSNCSLPRVMNVNIRHLHPSHNQDPGNSDICVDPYKLVEDEIKAMFILIKKDLFASQLELKGIAEYYFDGKGKAFRPVIVILMAKALAVHIYGCERDLLPSQRQVAMISEMVHTASLMHDDVIDNSDIRRGKPSIYKLWSQRKAVSAGDYVLSVGAKLLSQIGNDDVTIVLSQVLVDLVQGEFMQLGAKEAENERFSHYLLKTYKKTASLIAHSCKAVAILSGANATLQEIAFQYGKNIGIAFQLVDDLLDFVSSRDVMGKPAAVDLRLGLATAPVLFACEKHPELNSMILRRFSHHGDVERAYEYVLKSDGINQTRFLAEKHCIEAINLLNHLSDCVERKALINMTSRVLNRMK